MSDTVARGAWVEIERQVLAPSERAASCPDDTRATPYVMRLSGFLAEDAALGDRVLVTSLIGHSHEGVLVRLNPSYEHSFGPTVAELLHIGRTGASA